LSFTLRDIPAGAKLTDEIALQVIDSAVPRSVVEAVATDFAVAGQRQRKLTTEVTILLTVAMNLFTRQSLQQVLVAMITGLRYVWPDPDFAIATKGAITKARYRLGASPVIELFHRVCRPLAVEATSGAFLFGLRLMALDTTMEDVPDTPENAKTFGRHHSNRGKSAFPQVMGAYLSESGTHAIVDAGFWPCHADQHAAVRQLLRSVESGMLLMWDAGLHSFDTARKTLARGAQFLSRVPASVRFEPLKLLTDGSYLANIYEPKGRRRPSDEHLLVRVIEYTISDPNRPGCGKNHRIMTSLPDPGQYPALEMVLAYHERWEVEIMIDEIDTHQRLPQRPLRSQKPIGVIQEFYGLLIAHYAIRRVMHDSALQYGLDPDRISFVNSVQLICGAITVFQMAAEDQRKMLYPLLLHQIAFYHLPNRANRNNPRVVKRKMSKFNLKRPEHQNWPQPTSTFRKAVTILK
jgi:hypothetical protein